MPNIVADRGVCPELVNEDATPEAIADIALSLLGDDERLRRMKSELGEVRARLGEPGAVDRAARAVLEMGGLS
jgi:lipid-A-disaccharide synthase